MELIKALDLLIACASVNLVNQEIKDAIETVKFHKQELENPSPIQVVLFIHGGVIHESISNVPVSITTLDEDIDGWNHTVTLASEDATDYDVGCVFTECDPQRIATILSEAND